MPIYEYVYPTCGRIFDHYWRTMSGHEIPAAGAVT